MGLLFLPSVRHSMGTLNDNYAFKVLSIKWNLKMIYQNYTVTYQFEMPVACYYMYFSVKIHFGIFKAKAKVGVS